MTSSPSSLSANPWVTRSVRIDQIIREATGVATYRLSEVDSVTTASQSFAPGQFNMLYLPGVGESAISMSGDPTQTEGWIHTVRVAGNVTKTLAGLSCGATLGLRGPFGTGWPIDDLVAKDIVIVAGGLGLAPLRPLVYHLLNHRARHQRIWLICGARTEDGLLYQSEYSSWRQKGIDVQVTIDRSSENWNGHVGVVTTLIDRLQITRPGETVMLSCGPEVMMKYAAVSGQRLGIDAQRIWVSLERNMQCGAGFCGHCQLGPEFLCKDGPVLRYDRIRQYLFVEQL